MPAYSEGTKFICCEVKYKNPCLSLISFFLRTMNSKFVFDFSNLFYQSDCFDLSSEQLSPYDVFRVVEVYSDQTTLFIKS